MKILLYLLLVLSLSVSAPVYAVKQCKNNRLGTHPNGTKYCLTFIYDDHVRCPNNKPSNSCFGFRVDPGSQGPSLQPEKLKTMPGSTLNKGMAN